MKNVKILDCTLRDGGRIIDCSFPDEEIRQISYKLINAKIDIIEIGFLRDGNKVRYQGNSTFFTNIDQITPFLMKEKATALYVAFADYGMFDFNVLKKNDDQTIDGIRVGFTRKDYYRNFKDIINCMNIVKNKGYKLFIQAVNILGYTDREILELVDRVNEIQPYSFGIVDTYGAMYLEDLNRIYNMVDHNLDENIHIDFHSHNNYQLSFALAQEIINLSNGKRNVIIDATLNGMGKGAGNLNTELIVDYLSRCKNYDYGLDNILDIIDEHLYVIREKYKWGYSIASLMAGIYKAHPNNIIYLTEKFRLDTKDIKYILSMIDDDSRQRYDYDNIKKLYIEYTADKVKDYDAIQKLKKIFELKKILVLIPGKSLVDYQNEILEAVNQQNVIVISVNFISSLFPLKYAFFGNQKKFNYFNHDKNKPEFIVTSNIKNRNDGDIVVNYHSIIDRRFKYFDNSAFMLLHLLKKVNVKYIAIAGFDGFSKDKVNFYDNEGYYEERLKDQYDEVNTELLKMFDDFVKSSDETCKISFLTPSPFQECLRN